MNFSIFIDILANTLILYDVTKALNMQSHMWMNAFFLVFHSNGIRCGQNELVLQIGNNHMACKISVDTYQPVYLPLNILGPVVQS